MKTCASLFSGGGGADLGMIAAGLKPMWAVEYDAEIAEVYRRNIGDHVQVCKVQDVDLNKLSPVDMLWASPVCKNFSTAKINGEETDEDMEAANGVSRIIRHLTPPVVLLENVLAYRKSRSLANILGTMEKLGYWLSLESVNAANYGVPQTRKRLIIRATRDRLVPPMPTKVERWIGWYEAIEDLLPTLPESKFAEWQLQRLPEEIGNFIMESKFPGRNAKAMYVNGQSPVHTVTAVNPDWKAFLIPGDNTNNKTVLAADQPMVTVNTNTPSKNTIRAFLVNKSNDKWGDGVRYDQEPAHTVTVQQGGVRAFVVDGAGNGFDGEGSVTVRKAQVPMFTLTASIWKRPIRAWLDEGRVVTMTPRALARFQSFPDSYVLPEKTSLACKVIGNAVPPLLAQKMVESLCF